MGCDESSTGSFEAEAPRAGREQGASRAAAPRLAAPAGVVSMVVDTDIGTDVDDALALVLAAVDLRVRLRGVTTTGGRTEVRAALADKLLRLCGRRVPVVAGASEPLPPRLFDRWLPEPVWGGHEGIPVLGAREIAEAPPAARGAAATFLRETASEEQQLVVLCLGPLTNVAEALASRPTAAQGIERIVLMGGVVTGPARAAGVPLDALCEYNLNADREAAWSVLTSGVPVSIVPAEVTYPTHLLVEDIERLRAHGHPVNDALAALMDVWLPLFHQLCGRHGVPGEISASWACHLHDPLAVLTVLEPGLCRMRDARLALELQHGVLRLVERAEGPVRASVVAAADPTQVRRAVLRRLLGLPTPPASRD